MWLIFQVQSLPRDVSSVDAVALFCSLGRLLFCSHLAIVHDLLDASVDCIYVDM
ncbi:hypothetical protein KFK09_020149 [Dendrobium nobile]|uniref:Uncharacterized protein n=1 Tax=Dendrobium nobile TaxID=94219 RepID=A0A8T3ARI5_DENNO|nr:hypothetical protein KFK09_020149 [Dendrobium nobile]